MINFHKIKCVIFNEIAASQCEVNQYLNAEEMSPKRKSQATSPNLPLNDLTINEEEVSDSKKFQILKIKIKFSYFRNQFPQQ